ncbi:hypothetical protein RchiOBHm_Chr1g0382231 [Rosa chinensis]|uniref:Uncharacterized protein n=1 Tax=Rosa chinensis TaxID=74649 RepID=A0A2P6SPE5_ROSCH|nr:hypothetical protein RchiOBHm_Chr1g0382231 [Rosa chinensis]
MGNDYLVTKNFNIYVPPPRIGYKISISFQPKMRTELEMGMFSFVAKECKVALVSSVKVAKLLPSLL